jgi:hypothetical protein
MVNLGKVNRNPVNGWIVASVPAPARGKQGWMPCMFWCQEHLDGESLDINSARSYGKNWRYVGEGVFEFRRRDNHLMFLLAWS